MIAKSLFYPAFAGRPRPSSDELLLPDTDTGSEGVRLRAVLGATTSEDLLPNMIRSEVEGRLWMLTPGAFRYFLPAFLTASLDDYSALRTFVAELVTALTKPTAGDIVQALDRVGEIPAEMGLKSDTLELLRRQQLDWYNSGTPSATFESRVDGLSLAEGAAILRFLRMINDAHSQEFPFQEPRVAIDRHWFRYTEENSDSTD